MLPRSLHARLATALLLILAAVGAANLYSTLVTTELYLQEVHQNMNLDLARNIAAMKHEKLLDPYGEIRRDGVEELLSWMMVVNPGPHFYLLDRDGRVIAYDPAAGKINLDMVDLNPIRDFLKPHRPTRTLLGDDPRDPGKPKIFSVSPIPPEGIPRGYLYIVLAGRDVESVMARLRDSYILRLSTRNGLVYLAVVLLTGFLVFSLLTRPLRRLGARMRRFCLSEPAAETTPAKSGTVPDDEVRLLERTFHEMSERIETQMAEIERMGQTRRELIANVSHDLRTPIASLRGYLDTLALKDDSLSPQEREEYLGIAVRQSERLGKLVDELFELTKLDAKEVEPRLERFKLTELVQDNVQRFQLEAEGLGVTLKADYDTDLSPVFADIGLMERVLENLIENALRATPRGGSVTVFLREKPHRLVVSVVDTGRGISERDLPHIFERYYRARDHGGSSYQGTGLGLAITKRILDLHKSEIEADSEIGRGTRVTFSLTVAPRSHQIATRDLQPFLLEGP